MYLMKSPLLLLAPLCLAMLPIISIATPQNVKPAPPASPETLRLFENKVRPIIVGKCQDCHKGTTASGGFKLDQNITLAQAQLLLARIKGENNKDRMPLGGPPLNSEQIKDIELWVRQGAGMPAISNTPAPTDSMLFKMGKTHWSFQPLKTPVVPMVKNKAWIKNPIDNFILAKLETKNLKPAQAIGKRALIRRLTYDLIGLPPISEEVEAFVSDTSPNAYAKVVDRLLASPHYGEKWGRHWLDLVRYAETNSYERDNPKPNAFRYRDYVIDALNKDIPYNQFLTEQIAGDEMPGARPEAVIGTGFYRLGIWDDEPTDREQARYDGLDDIVTTVGQTTMALTFDCARCHDHKIDPILQKDYYQLVSFFQGVNHYRNGGPTDEKPLFANANAKSQYEAALVTLGKERDGVQKQITAIEKEFQEKYSKGGGEAIANSDLQDVTYKYYRDTFEKLPKFDTLKFEREGKIASNLFDITIRDRDEAFGIVFEGTLIVPKSGRCVFFLDSDDGSRLLIDGISVVENDGIHGQGKEKTGFLELPAGRHAIRLEYFQNQYGIGLNLAWAGPSVPRRMLSTFNSAGEAAKVNLSSVITAEGERVLGAENLAQYKTLSKQLQELKDKQVPVDRALCVTEDVNNVPDTFVLARGNPAAKTDKVVPAFPLICGGGRPNLAPIPTKPTAELSKDDFRRPVVGTLSLANMPTTGRRLALAKWLVKPDHILTTRVIANRLWQHHFGRGIVRTPNDFGLQGTPPTHPELLDYLATELVKNGWSLKKMHKLIVSSNTYQMASTPNQAAYKVDPTNDLFWKFDMRRLTAEELRDSILFVSGNINLKMGGPSVYPDIQQEVLQGQSIPGYGWNVKDMKPEDKARRSIYVHVKRSLLLPILVAFDNAETDRTLPLRFASTQPTQALALLNSKFLQAQATLLSEQVKSPENSVFVKGILRRVTQRPSTEKEITRGVALIEKLEKSGMNEANARKNFCLMALNLNEFIYLD
jgi:mono/diheme cytochrome c family protein